MTETPKTRCVIALPPDGAEARARLLQALGNALNLEDLQALVKVVREQPALIQAAKGFLKG